MAENEKKVQDAEVKAGKADKKPAKPSLWKRFTAWCRSLRSECKKIVWASFPSVRYNTILVIVCAVICSVVIGLLDFGFSNAIQGLAQLI